jgi:hypothetical protein
VGELFFSSFDTEMVQPPFVRTGKELALHRRRAIKGHAAREAKRTDNAVREVKRTESLKRRASLPQNRTFECEDPADFAQLKDALNAAKDALVVVERVIQKYAPQDKPAAEQVLAYPGEASADQPFMQELFDNWDAQKIAHSVAEAALGRPDGHGSSLLFPTTSAAVLATWASLLSALYATLQYLNFRICLGY